MNESKEEDQVQSQNLRSSLVTLTVEQSDSGYGRIILDGIYMGLRENASGNGAHLACGDVFPTCLNEGRLLPFGESRLTDIHLTHRALVYIATAAILLEVLIPTSTNPGDWMWPFGLGQNQARS